MRLEGVGVMKIGLSDVYKECTAFSTCNRCRIAPELTTMLPSMIDDLFHQKFGEEPAVTVVSPGRINLIGEHIDYLGGEVMPIAIDRSLRIDALPLEGNVCEIFPEGLGIEEPATFDLSELQVRKEKFEVWLNYIIGVIAVYRDAGVMSPAFRATIHSDLPVGAGLSSSAALETAIALVIESLSGIEQDVVDRALLCQRAEHDFAGVPCGIMDQMAVGAGKAGQVMRLNCGNLSRSYFPIPRGISILTADTGVKHALGDGEYRKRREDCEMVLRRLEVDSFATLATRGDLEKTKDKIGTRLFHRASHVVSEMARVDSFSQALVAGDLDELGQLMRAGHESLRDDFEVSCVELDALVDAAYSIGRRGGVVGSRMTGGGFGGSTVSLVATESAPDVKRSLEEFYQEKFGRDLNCFITTAVDGAHVVSLSQNSKD